MARHKGRRKGKRGIAEMGEDPPLKMPKIADQARPETPAAMIAQAAESKTQTSPAEPGAERSEIAP